MRVFGFEAINHLFRWFDTTSFCVGAAAFQRGVQRRQPAFEMLTKIIGSRHNKPRMYSYIGMGGA